MTIKEYKAKATQNKYLLLALLLVVMCFIVPILCRLFTMLDLWQQTAGAVLGVAISAVITCLMLENQTHTEVLKERDSKVYEQKLLVCKEFLDNFNDVFVAGIVTTETTNALKLSFAKLAIHLDGEALTRISKHMGDFFDNKSVGVDHEQQDKAETWEQRLLEISSTIRGQLYSLEHKAPGEHCPDTIRDIIENLDNMNRPEEGDESEVKEKGTQGDNIVTPEVLSDRQSQYALFLGKLKKRLEAHSDTNPYWRVDVLEGCKLGIVPMSTTWNRTGGEWDNSQKLAIFLTWETPESHLFQCHVDFAGDNDARKSLYKPMRRELKGQYCTWSWYQRIRGEYAQILLTPEWAPEQEELMLSYACEKLKSIMDYVRLYMDTCDLSDDLQKDISMDGWEWRVWENNIVYITNEENPKMVWDFRKEGSEYIAVRIRGLESDGIKKFRQTPGVKHIGKDEVCYNNRSREELIALLKTSLS